MTVVQRLNTNINELDESLLAAVVDGNVKKAEKALLRGADIETHEVEKGRTPLHIACLLRQVAMAKMLIRHGADVNSLNFCELTPLIETALDGNLETAKLLIQHGADWRAVDNDGNSALTYTFANPNIAVFDYLLELGADIRQENFYGRIVLDYLLNFPRKNAEHGKLALRLFEMMGLDPAKSLYKRKALEEYLADAPEALHVLREHVAKRVCGEIQKSFDGLNEVGDQSLESSPPNWVDVALKNSRPLYCSAL